jgi:hypothetical protein
MLFSLLSNRQILYPGSSGWKRREAQNFSEVNQHTGIMALQERGEQITRILPQGHEKKIRADPHFCSQVCHRRVGRVKSILLRLSLLGKRPGRACKKRLKHALCGQQLFFRQLLHNTEYFLVDFVPRHGASLYCSYENRACICKNFQTMHGTVQGNLQYHWVPSLSRSRGRDKSRQRSVYTKPHTLHISLLEVRGKK